MTVSDPYPAERPGDAVVPSRGRAEAARATMTALAASADVFETFFDQARIGLALADLGDPAAAADVQHGLDPVARDLVRDRDIMEQAHGEARRRYLPGRANYQFG